MVRRRRVLRSHLGVSDERDRSDLRLGIARSCGFACRGTHDQAARPAASGVIEPVALVGGKSLGSAQSFLTRRKKASAQTVLTAA
jgi:hypothetical protein